MAAVNALSLPARIGRFGFVGIAGFIADAATLVILVAAGLDPFSGRVASMLIAALVTWRLNRSFTFGASSTSEASEGVRYGLVAVTVAAMNYGIYAGLLLAFPGLWPPVALAVATAISMWMSFLGYSRIAFRRKS